MPDRTVTMSKHNQMDIIIGLILSFAFFILAPVLFIKLVNNLEERDNNREIDDVEYKIVAYKLSAIEELKPTIAKTMEDQKITREEYREIHRADKEINRKKLQQDILNSVQRAEQ